ncbi:MAG: LEPR-XLL domain-containing protein, partial [Deltaproteobacteria bacterium]|nr:LEPR-XLL domain-containing protein [Deltaproteobacteria bacterium]
MKRSQLPNLFELESLEERIMLSGDPLFGAIHVVAPDQLDRLFDAAPEAPGVEEVLISGEDTSQDQSAHQPSEYDPAKNLDDIFSGLTDEDDSARSDDNPDQDHPRSGRGTMGSRSPLGALTNADITEAQEAAILQGLEELANFGNLLGDFSDFAAQLPLIDTSDLGGLLGFYEILHDSLYTPVYDYFNDATDPPTTDDLLTALQDISGTYGALTITVSALTGGFDADDNEVRFSLNFGATRSGVVSLDVGNVPVEAGVVFEGEVELAFTACLTFDFTFGVDPGHQFFIAVDQLEARVHMDGENIEVGVTLNELPQLRLKVENGTVNLDARAEFVFHGLDPPGSPEVTLADFLDAQDSSSVVDIQTSGVLFAELPAAVSEAETPTSDSSQPILYIYVSSDNIFDPTCLDLSVDLNDVPLSSLTGELPSNLLQGNDLLGSGENFGDFTGYGVVSPGNSPGIENYTDFTLGSGETLLIEIGGLTPGPGPLENPDSGYDQVNVTNLATLDGTLAVSLINDFKPSLGDRFDFMTFGSLSGDFSAFTDLWIGDGLYFKPELQANKYVLEVAQVPGDIEDLNFDTTAMRDQFLTLIANKASGPISTSGSISIGDFVNIGGSIGFDRVGSQVRATGQGVSAEVVAGSFKIGVSGGTLAMVLNEDGTKALDVSGTFYFEGCGLASASASSVRVQLNDTSIDYSTASETIIINGVSADLTSAKDVQYVSVTGMNLEVNGFFYTSGNFTVEKSARTVTLSDGTTADVELLTIGASNVDAFAGVNGPASSGGAIGLSLTGVDFALALIAPEIIDPATQTDLRTWSAVKATVGGASFIGMEGFTVAVSNFYVAINQGGGTTNGVANATVVDFGGSPLTISTGGGNSIDLDFDGSDGSLLQANGTVSLDVFGFVTLDGSMAFKKA